MVMERRTFFKHLIGQMAQAVQGGYGVTLGTRRVVFYEGITPALPLWLAPSGTAAFDAVCHLCAQNLTATQAKTLAHQTACPFPHIIASHFRQKADAYILFAPSLTTLPQAPALLLFTPSEAQRVATRLPDILKKLPSGSDIFVGNVDNWHQPHSPTHGRIQLFLSQIPRR